MSFRALVGSNAGRPVYELIDDDSGAFARILPSYGFNLFDLRLPAAGAVRRVVAAREDWEKSPDKPARNGVPILFPYPGRIADASFSFQGETYSLPPAKPPNAIHGFAHEADWEVVEHAADENQARIKGRFQISKQTPRYLPCWPADAVLEVEYALSGRTLGMTIAVENPTDRPLPFGFGIHPYFHLPLAAAGDPARTKAIFPADEYWELENSLPTGRRLPVDERLDFRRGRPMKGLSLDDVLTHLRFERERCVCRLIDEALGAEFRLIFGPTFRELVLFTPPGNQDRVIAVEPYTQAPDAVHLRERGIDAGLRILPPEERLVMRIGFETVEEINRSEPGGPRANSGLE